MPNPEKKVELGAVEPQEQEDLLKGRFKFSESERKKMSEEGIDKEEISRKEEDITRKQELARQEAAEREEVKSEGKPEKRGKKISFEEYKAQQEAEFQQKVAKSRKDLEKAYGQEDSKQEKEEVAL